MKIGKVLYTLLILVLVAVFAFSAYYVASYFLEGKEQQAQYDNLANMVESVRNDPTYSVEEYYENPVIGETVVTPEGIVEEKIVLPEYAPVYELNNHLVGWITIADTKINYPVMQTPDSVDYYLKRSFEQKKSSRGCLYVREVCDVNTPSDNVTIYGHNMKDGSMFGGLERYKKQTYWEEHRYIQFDTIYEHHTYEIFAVFKTTATIDEGFPYHKFVDAADEEAFDSFVSTCRELAFYDTGIVPQYGDKLICLSTCEYTQRNGRFVVVAVRRN